VVNLGTRSVTRHKLSTGARPSLAEYGQGHRYQFLLEAAPGPAGQNLGDLLGLAQAAEHATSRILAAQVVEADPSYRQWVVDST
jgi:hypothetical protein